ncbi:adenylate/guanylate cyclase domain-containing protein [uncultured Tateyamaria sp.]|uniref:adenylate/guanylate cyclase domain-containing protein n=1 Tax=uncultured Tateyamaria sp. TaxID=455651 RepID=UPI00261A2A8E|nr:adenylate/guanylate cyclase domain-containing protein [uncultured Tateyamaria sp.]
MSDPFSPSPELAAIAKRWLDMHARRQTKSAANLFSNSAAVTFIGSDADELITGPNFRETFESFYNDHVNLIPRDIIATAYEAGDFGWAYTTLTVEAPDAGKVARFRISMVFTLEEGVWRIVHVHNSNPTPNMDSMGYEARNLEELAAAAQSPSFDLGRTGIATVMFTDIVDSTALAAAIGDTAWSGTVTTHLNDITSCVQGSDGTLVKTLGDGTLSTFSSAQAAMIAAKSIMERACSTLQEPYLRVRIGLHTGDVVEAKGDYLGSVVNKAARVAAMAAPDEIRVSDATRAMIGGSTGFEFTDPVSVPLKGLEGEHVIYRLSWRPPDA